MRKKAIAKAMRKKTKAQPKRVVFYVHRSGLTLKIKFYNEFHNPESTNTLL